MRRVSLLLVSMALAGCAGQEPVPTGPAPAALTDRLFNATPDILVPLIGKSLSGQGFKITQSTTLPGFVQATRDSHESGFKSVFSSLTLGYPKNRVQTTATAMIQTSGPSSTVHLTLQDITLDVNGRPVETHGNADPKLYSATWDSITASLPTSSAPATPTP